MRLKSFFTDTSVDRAYKAISKINMPKDDRDALWEGMAKFAQANIRIIADPRASSWSAIRNQYLFSSAMKEMAYAADDFLRIKEKYIKPIAFISAGIGLTLLTQSVFGNEEIPEQPQPLATPEISIDG